MSQQINLFNPLFLKQKKHFSAVTIAQALGVLFVAMMGFYAYAFLQVDGLEKQAREGGRQQQVQQERLTRLTAQLGAVQQDPVEQEIRALQASINSRQALVTSMNTGALGGASGYAEYMRALARQNVGGLWLTGFRIGEGGGDFALSGRALQAELVPAYIRRLGNEPVMRGRSLDGLTLTTAIQSVPASNVDAAKAGSGAVSVIEFRIGTSHAALDMLVPPGKGQDGVAVEGDPKGAELAAAKAAVAAGAVVQKAAP